MAERPWTIVRGGLVLRGAECRAEFLDVLIQGDTVAALGPPGMAAPADAAVVDASDRLLHAGLINAHTHGYGSYTKGVGDRWTLELLLTAGAWLNADRSLADKALSATLNAAEMLLKGCTACYDLYAEAPVPTSEGMRAVAQAYRAAGMRATLAPMAGNQSFYETIPGLLQALPPDLRAAVGRFQPQDHRRILSEVDAFLRTEGDGDRIKVALAPTIPLVCSDDYLLACRDVAADLGIGIHTHIAESKVQALAYQERYGRSVVAQLDALGMLNPGFVLAHAIWLDDADLRIVGERGASIAHNPGCNMRLGSGIADFRAMLDHGVNVGIGTDGSTSSDNQNMYEAQRLASLASKVLGPDYANWISTREALHAATEGSARCLGFGGMLGRIDPGYKADIVFLDLGHINWVPRNDVVNQLVHVEDGASLRDVMVGGEFVVRERRLVRVDLAALRGEVERAQERLRASTAERRELAEKLSKAVGAFCLCLAERPYHINRWAAYR